LKIGVACAIAAVVAHLEFSPARYRAGTVPDVPISAVGGGQVFVEVSVNAEGRVTGTTPLRVTPPFTDVVVDAVRSWEFHPAIENIESKPEQPRERGTLVASKVLVAAVFRPPVLFGPTLGESPHDIAWPSDATPFPVNTTLPSYPPTARDSGVVLLEVHVELDGSVSDVSISHSAPPFDDVARAAVRQWRFRPGRVRETPVSTLAYVMFGFAVPVGSPPRKGE
jgi:TonB family protein